MLESKSQSLSQDIRKPCTEQPTLNESCGAKSSTLVVPKLPVNLSLKSEMVFEFPS